MAKLVLAAGVPHPPRLVFESAVVQLVRVRERTRHAPPRPTAGRW